MRALSLANAYKVDPMQTPVNLEIQGLRASAHLREIIERNLGKLGRLFGRITACHVTVRAPNLHHRNGEEYHVTIRLALADRKDINVSPPPRGLDKRQADVTFAVNDAFKRAESQLRRQVSRLKAKPGQG